MPSSSTGIERSVSPSPRSRSIPQDPTSSRYRPSTTTTAQYNTPELGNVMHSLHHRPSPHHNPYNPVVAANGYVTSSSDPRRAGSGEATLSNTLTNLYRSAVSSFAPSSSSSSSSSSQYQPFTNLEPSPSSLSPRIASTTTTGTARRKRGGGEPASSSLRLTVPAPSTVGFVALCCLWYLSSALSSNTGKSILTRFRYPVTLTFVQFAFVAWYSLVVLVVRARIAHWRITTTNNSPSTTKGGQRRRSSFGQAAETAINNTLRGWGVRKPTRSMFHGTFTMSLFQIAGHVFSSMAIARVPVSTVHTIKVKNPISLSSRKSFLRIDTDLRSLHSCTIRHCRPCSPSCRTSRYLECATRHGRTCRCSRSRSASCSRARLTCARTRSGSCARSVRPLSLSRKTSFRKNSCRKSLRRRHQEEEEEEEEAKRCRLRIRKERVVVEEEEEVTEQSWTR